MIYLISWRGRGLMALGVVLIPIALAIASDAMFGKYFPLAFSSGFVAVGAACWVFGRKWNGTERLHTLGPAKLQTWGIIWMVFGLLLLPGGIGAARHGF
jgi:hypothetical protein